MEVRLVDKKRGHGDPLWWVRPGTTTFSNALQGGRLPCLTLRERTMLAVMNTITDKPKWRKKVFDEDITEKWMIELVTYEDEPIETQVTEEMFNYCIEELQHWASLRKEVPMGATYVFPGAVWKSDRAVSEETRLALIEAVRGLEDIPEDEKDWHPGSDGKVLDLVHPSMYPLVYSKTRILPHGAPATTLDDCIARCGEGGTIQVPQGNVADQPPNFEKTYSKNFQWLPCDVDITGEKPRILSYINNLHPRTHRRLYHIIEDIIGASIPLWELALYEQHCPYPGTPQRINYTRADYDIHPEANPDPDHPRPEREEGEDEDAYEERYDEWRDWYRDNRSVIQPEPGDFSPFQAPKTGWIGTLVRPGPRTPLQVIVKLANIELTPEKPEYEGGTWHLEGQMNEEIVASSIYYYSSKNITSSSLAFRYETGYPDFDVDYEQDYHEWLPEVFGLEQDGPPIQGLGSVSTPQGRLVAFTNMLQHQVQPFKLQDPSKPGHRKILALFLVDPRIPIISTSDVPVQRVDWWQHEYLHNTNAKGTLGSVRAEMRERVLTLPAELQSLIFKFAAGFPLEQGVAEECRERLMEERKAFLIDHQNNSAAHTISLCEH